MKTSAFVPVHLGADDYDSASRWMDIIHPDRRGVVAGTAKRCGITRPWYRTRGTYRLSTGWFQDAETYEPGIYVYDAGRFHEVNSWHEAEEEAGRYPVVDPPKPAIGRRRKGSKK